MNEQDRDAPPDEHEDALVQRAVAGDEEALVELLEACAPALRGRLAANLPRARQSVLSVDDVLQQAFADAFVAIRRFKPYGPGAFRAWVHTLARHAMLEALAMLDAAKRGGGRRQVHAGSEQSLEALFGAVSSCGGVSTAAAGAESLRLLQSAVAQLPPTHRLVIEQYDLQGQPIESLCEALGRSEGAVYMLRARAMRMLAHSMGRASMHL